VRVYCVVLCGYNRENHTEEFAAAIMHKSDMIQMLVDAHPDAVCQMRGDGKFLLDLAFEELASVDTVRSIVPVWPNTLHESYRNGTFLFHVAVQHGAPMDVLMYLIKQRPESLRQVKENSRIALHQQGKATGSGLSRFW
jgi:hypothetical protein